MSQIIPRNLIKHLEWNPDSKPAGSPRVPQGGAPPQNPIQSQGSVIVKPELLKYIQVGINGIHGQPVIISPFELDDFNNMNYDDAHTKLLETDLYMPTPKIFRTHFNNVAAAHKDERKLFYADGSEVPKPVITDMYKHMVQDHKDIYGQGNAGVWTWLNARFVKGNGFNGFGLETVMGLGKREGKFEVDKAELEKCVWSDSYVDLSFNNQGLANKPSKRQQYKKGKNIYFLYPRENAVAGFYANSDWAYLSCGRNPTLVNASLGVFGCAEGANAKNQGGSSK